MTESIAASQNAGEHPLSVLLLEDISAVADRMAGIIRSWNRARLLPVCGTVTEAQNALRHSRVDILIADLNLPDGLGVEAIKTMRETNPDAHAIVMSVLNDGPIVFEAIRAGATGYVVKDDDSIGVLAAIEMVLEGKSPMSATIARQIVDSLHNGGGSATVAGNENTGIGLTPRERDVLNYIARGYSYREVAELLGISMQTVPVHTRNIYRKLEVTSKTEAVFQARQKGLID
ncbi:MAG: response regulator transcription factor [Hyphomicrobiaceae bacterium]|nr:response regulator transcription factor [Hyphomicrobiaceae bacterium]MCC0023955.1 response regulator transcription factor [Hyphomicrobiaceae bacterium]